MQQPNTATDFAPVELLRYRASAQRRRAAAFAAPYDAVAGILLVPVTPSSYSRLFATGNAFAYGTAPRAIDVRNYIWFHWPTFTIDPVRQPIERSACERAISRKLRISWVARWRLLCLSGLSPRKFSRRYRRLQAARFAYMVAQIREVWTETFADGPPRGSGFYIGATLEAQFVHLLGSALGWKPEYSAHYPLRMAYQLLRVIKASRQGENYVEQDPEEDALIATLLIVDAAKNCLPANTPAAA